MLNLVFLYVTVSTLKPTVGIVETLLWSLSLYRIAVCEHSHLLVFPELSSPSTRIRSSRLPNSLPFSRENRAPIDAPSTPRAPSNTYHVITMAPAPLTLHQRCCVAKLGAGEVLFVGQTSFAPGLWIGVQLDAPLGKNDGSVQGKRYFHAEPNYGVFVRPSQVDAVGASEAPQTPRAPTKDAAVSVPRTEPQPSRLWTPEARSRVAAPSSVGRTGAQDSPTVRAVDRARAALHRPGARASPAGVPVPRAPATPAASALGTPALRTDGRPVASERARSGLPSARGAMGTPTSARDVYDSPSAARTRLSTPARSTIARPAPSSARRAAPSTGAVGTGVRTPRTAPTTPVSPVRRTAATSPEARDTAPTSNAATERIAALVEQLRHAEARCAGAERRATEDAMAAASARAAAEAAEARAAHCDTAEHELGAVRATLAELQDTHATRIEELTEALEMATLDREMAEEKAEQLAHELHASKDTVEELQLEVQLRKEHAALDEAAAREAMPVEQAQLEQQNARLKEALVRLRDASRETDATQKKELAALRADAEAAHELRARLEATETKLVHAERAVEELRAQAHLAAGAEELLEQLTERNGALEAHAEQLRAEVDELDTLRAINDELEETHLETEAQLQHELAVRDETIAKLQADASAHAAQLADYDATLHKFREVVRDQVHELEQLRARGASAEAPSGAAPAAARAAPALLGAPPQLAQARALHHSLERLDAAQAQRHLDVVRVYLPPTFWAADEAAVGTLLVLERIARLGTLLREALAAHADVQDRLLAGTLDEALLDACALRHALAHLAALAEQAAAALATAPPDVFVAQARHAAALAPAEQQLRQLLEDVQRDRWDEHACRRTCDAIVPQLEQVSLALQTHVSVADLAAKEAGSASLAAHDVDTLLAAAGLAHAQLRTLAERTGLAADDAVEQAASLVRIARRARVPARNMVRILTSLRAAHEAVHIESVPQLPGLGQLSSQLAALAAKMAHGVCALVRAAEIDAGAATPDALRAALPDDGAAAVRDAERLAATLDALHTAIADPANAIPVDDAVPWTARASTLHAAMQHSAAHDAEIAERTAREAALQRALQARTDQVEADAVQIERLAYQLDKARTLATSASDLRAEVEALHAQLEQAHGPAPRDASAPAPAPAAGDTRRALRVLRAENQSLRAREYLATLASLAPLPKPQRQAASEAPWDALADEARRLAAAPCVVDISKPSRRAAVQYEAQCRARCRLSEQVARLV